MFNTKRIRHNAIHVGVRMPPELHKQLMKYAIRKRQPLSVTVRELLAKGLEQ